ncbi:MAG TPA: farnesyl diphosphate synthase, partial [Burkholderiaceae bacterium]|nr:farnesyl diphosphate synthase [Burkholderiaceae bacterium]
MSDWITARQGRFEQFVQAHLPAEEREPRRLHGAMRYAVLNGGKRVRPLLVYAAGEFAGAADTALDPIAAAIEFVHAYSLVHDDMPCMDDDVLRRGKPTVHVAFDEATAMLTGDALQAEAFRVLADAPVAAETAMALIRDLAQASGTQGMCGGQAIDLAAVGQAMTAAELETMHRMKTGALLRASITMGATAGRVSIAERAVLERYADAVGLAFQVVDDLLDAVATSAELGKTAGKDQRQSKPTYVSVLGTEATRRWSERLRAEAHDALSSLGSEA